MKPSVQERFDALYERHLRGLKLHGYSASTSLKLIPCFRGFDSLLESSSSKL